MESKKSESDFVLVYLTFPSQESAKKIVMDLLEKKLLACANIFPQGTSVYLWEGKVCQESECVVFGKTNHFNFKALEEYVVHHHSYTIPCVLKLGIEDGHGPFLHWLSKNLLPETD